MLISLTAHKKGGDRVQQRRDEQKSENKNGIVSAVVIRENSKGGIEAHVQKSSALNTKEELLSSLSVQ